jgi:p-aminobenzoyl-glutamate transporter AbgT
MLYKVIALSASKTWDNLLTSQLGHWISTKGLHIVLVLVGAWIATRVIRGVANRISRRLDQKVELGSEVRSESVKHRKAVASVISSVAVAVLYIVVSVDIINTLGLPVGSFRRSGSAHDHRFLERCARHGRGRHAAGHQTAHQRW